MYRRIPLALFAASAAFALACSDSSTTGPASQTSRTDGTAGSTDSVNTHLPVHTPAEGPVASIRSWSDRPGMKPITR